MLNCNLYAEIFNGMTLYAPIVSGANTHQTYLIDNQTKVVNVWTHESGVASIPYLLEDITLLYPYRVENPSMNAAGVGGGISKYSWDGDLLWSFNHQAAGGLGSDVESVVKRLMKKVARNFPYKK